MKILKVAAAALAIWGALFLLSFAWAAISSAFYLLCEKNKEKAKAEILPYMKFKPWTAVVTVLGVVCLVGGIFGFAETPGHIFEKRNYTAYYNGFATLDAPGVSVDYFPVVVRVEMDDERYVDRLYFKGGYMPAYNEERITKESLFDAFEVSDAFSDDWEFKWIVSATDKCTEDEVNNLPSKELSLDQWEKMLDYQCGECVICKKVKTEVDSFIVNGERILCCWRCLETKTREELRVVVDGEEYFFVPAEW